MIDRRYLLILVTKIDKKPHRYYQIAESRADALDSALLATEQRTQALYYVLLQLYLKHLCEKGKWAKDFGTEKINNAVCQDGLLTLDNHRRTRTSPFGKKVCL